MEKVKKTQQEASRTLQEMHFSNTNSFPTGWRSAGGHQLLLLLVRAVRLAPADLSSRPPLQPLSARPQPPAPPAAREGGGRVHFELISAVKGSNNKINALGSSGPAERRGTRANGAGSSRGGGLENSTRSAFETQLPDPFCRCSGAGSSEPMGGLRDTVPQGEHRNGTPQTFCPAPPVAHACLGLLWAPRAPGLPPSTAALGHPNPKLLHGDGEGNVRPVRRTGCFSALGCPAARKLFAAPLPRNGKQTGTAGRGGRRGKKGLIVQESGVGNFTGCSERSLEETQALRTASRPLGDSCAGNYA